MLAERIARLRFAATLASLVLAYILAVCADYALSAISEFRGKRQTQPARDAMARRYVEQDIKLFAEAQADGYEMVIALPLALETMAPLQALADAKGHAPVALQPDSDLVLCNEGYGALRLRTDRHGFRNPDSVWDRDTHDLALIGDSFAFGICLPHELTIAGGLEQAFNVVNLSMPGANATHYSVYLKLFFEAVAARRQVLMLYANDNAGFESARRIYEMYLAPDAVFTGSYAKGAPWPPAKDAADFTLAARKWQEERSARRPGRVGRAAARIAGHLSDLVGHYDLPVARAVASELWSAQNLPPDAVRMAIDLLTASCVPTACDPLIVYIPNSQYWDRDTRSPRFARHVGDYARSRNLAFLDMTATLQPMGRAAYARAGIHLSPEGNSAVARQILDHFGVPAGGAD